MLVENVVIDNVNLRIDKVTFTEYERFIQHMNYYRYGSNNNSLVVINEDEVLFQEVFTENIGSRESRYVHRFVNKDYSTDGNVFIGYRSNSAKPSDTYSLKIEFNPNKPTTQQEALLKAMHSVFDEKVIRLIELDLAIDVPYPIGDIYSCNTKGKYMSTKHTTRYYGEKHTDKYLKMYDKLKEQNISVSAKGSPHLTRIEFTLRPKGKDGLTYQQLKRHKYDLDSNYRIGLLSDITDFNLKCICMAFTNNLIKFSDIPRYEKDKVKKHLNANENKLYLNRIMDTYWDALIEDLSKWFLGSYKFTDNYALFGTEERELSEDEQLLFKEFMGFNNKKNLTTVGKLKCKIEE